MPDALTLVTGASSGIGREIAVTLSRTTRCLINGRDAARLQETADLCTKSGHAPLVWMHDLESLAEIESTLTAVLATESEKPSLRSFVHAAGVVQVLPIREMRADRVRQTMSVNLLAAIEIVRLMSSKRFNGEALRNIVFISSIFSVRGASGHAVYAASKGGLDSFMQSIATELAPRVRVNSVLPGAVRTPMAATALSDQSFSERASHEHLLGLGEPSDVAGCVEFLLSDKARWITGQKLIVDGGRTVR